MRNKPPRPRHMSVNTNVRSVCTVLGCQLAGGAYIFTHTRTHIHIYIYIHMYICIDLATTLPIYCSESVRGAWRPPNSSFNFILRLHRTIRGLATRSFNHVLVLVSLPLVTTRTRRSSNAGLVSNLPLMVVRQDDLTCRYLGLDNWKAASSTSPFNAESTKVELLEQTAMSHEPTLEWEVHPDSPSSVPQGPTQSAW